MLDPTYLRARRPVAPGRHGPITACGFRARGHRVFPSDGLSVWHSAGAGANQEVPHLHFHVHPRRLGDGLLRVYPAAPELPGRPTLDAWAAQLRAALGPAEPTAESSPGPDA